jgi:tetratricopeptide (TPR) repeat protein
VKAYQRGIELRPASALALTCRGRIGDCSFTLFNKSSDKKYLEQAVDEFKQLLKTDKLPALLREQTLFKLGRSYSLAGKPDAALDYYKQALLDYDNNRRSNPALSPIWAVKAAYEALRIYESDETPENIDRSISIYRKLKSFNLGTGEDFDKKIFDLQTKYQL